jgi:hypothetical protein
MGISFEPAEISDDKLDEFLAELVEKEDEISGESCNSTKTIFVQIYYSITNVKLVENLFA